MFKEELTVNALVPTALTGGCRLSAGKKWANLYIWEMHVAHNRFKIKHSVSLLGKTVHANL